jgi:hypothetical protein
VENNEQIAIMVIYIAAETLPFSSIANAMEKMLHRFHKIRNKPIKEV